MRIRELLSPEDILLESHAANKEEAIRLLVDSLDSQGHLISAEQCFLDILAREKEISTGLVQGIAIPHTQSTAVKTSKVSLVRLKEPIPWETLDESPVTLVLLITVPMTCQGEHLKILAALAERLMEEVVCQGLHEKGKEEIITLLEGEE